MLYEVIDHWRKKITAAGLYNLYPQGQGNTLASAVSHQGTCQFTTWGIKAEEVTATYSLQWSCCVGRVDKNWKANILEKVSCREVSLIGQIPLKDFADSQAAHAQRKQRNQQKQLYTTKISGGNRSLIALRTQKWAFRAAREEGKDPRLWVSKYQANQERGTEEFFFNKIK